MKKPFTTIAALLLAIVAAAHVYRIYSGFDITIGGETVPVWANWAGAIVAGFLALMLAVEAKK